MTAAERLYQLLQTLPDSQINEVLNFAEFLCQKRTLSAIEMLTDIPDRGLDITKAIENMRGLLKTDQPAPTDEEVTTMLEERRLEKYLPWEF